MNFSFSKDDAIKISKGLVIAMVGAGLTYLTQFVTGHDFGAYTPIVVALWGVIVNAIRKLIDEPVQKQTGVTI